MPPQRPHLALLLALLGVTRALRVAAVLGASRGIGKGVASALAAEGAADVVYLLGRSSDGLDATATAVAATGATARSYCVDLADDAAITRAAADIGAEAGRLDLLVYSAYSPPAGRLRGNFWEQEPDMWDACNGIGLRSTYLACAAFAPLLIRSAGASPPLVALVSSFGGRSFTFNVAYGVGKAAVDRLAADMAIQLKPFGVATTSIYPGVVRTERNVDLDERGLFKEASGGLGLGPGEAESPEFTGRALAALIGAPNLLERSGNVEVAAELATEFGFCDTDGTTPPSIRSLRFLLPNFVFPQIEAESGMRIPTWLRDNVPDLLLPWSVFGGPRPEGSAKVGVQDAS